ncbi:hypothetical protein SLEP1_g45156 [Rubroshorea leprosula]|uniref:non-specific serine/threonine protein kinase n=1 Tax=Rubroshorea leprosula TaxID=152421 RepID=A0AAV5LI71_9ROSI|nr:hypothetical protein SLEP1_g45156 [Rubroshorea leprosula]
MCHLLCIALTVQTLQTVFSKLQHNRGTVSRTSCTDGGWNYVTLNSDTIDILSNITCDCSHGNNTIYHVTNMHLKGLNLTGSLPSEFENLTHLTELDLTRNYLNGGFGPVYKGVLSDGVVIAVKQLSSKSKQGNREFLNEIVMISALQHPNLVNLYGCCTEGNQLLLVYEYMENNSLARALFGCEEHRLKLDWPTRMKICLGIAIGLTYLHEESRLKIVHRDIKATNVLLDRALNAKISDFGLAKLDEEENTHISTRITEQLGRATQVTCRRRTFVYLLDWAYVLQEHGNLLELVDPNLRSDYSTKEALRLLNLALLCTNPSPTLRPSMSSVVSMIEGKTAVQAPTVMRSNMSPDSQLRFRLQIVQFK